MLSLSILKVNKARKCRKVYATDACALFPMRERTMFDRFAFNDILI